jgi:hypothetical protein
MPMKINEEQMEEKTKEIINTYKHPLIWKFDFDIGDNCKYMYGNYSVNLKNTFFVFYEINDEYYIDIGCCYKYGDYDYGRFDFFNYGHEITKQTKLDSADPYKHLITELKSIPYFYGQCFDDYDITDSDTSYEDYYTEYIELNNGSIFWYKIDKETVFINKEEQLKFCTRYAQLSTPYV